MIYCEKCGDPAKIEDLKQMSDYKMVCDYCDYSDMEAKEKEKE